MAPYESLRAPNGVEVLKPFERVVSDLVGGGTPEETEIAEAVSERLLALRLKLQDPPRIPEAHRELRELASALAGIGYGPTARNTLLSTVARWRERDVQASREIQMAAVIGPRGVGGVSGWGVRGVGGWGVNVSPADRGRLALGLGLVAAGLLLRRATA